MPGKQPTAPKPVGPRLKPLFWKKIAVPDKRSIWNELKTTSLSTEDEFEDLVEAFRMDIKEDKSNAKGDRQTSDRKRSIIGSRAATSLLDITRANNIAIMLRRIKTDIREIREAILQVDDHKLSVDELQFIARQLPTPEEINRLKDYPDPSKLAIADRYFCEIMTIPYLSARLTSMIFRRTLSLEVEGIRPELAILRNATLELKRSTRLRTILQFVLKLGNRLNASTFRGGAQGFQMEALVKLKETRTAQTASPCPTLLHYLAKALRRSDPALIQFQEELPHLEEAARLTPQAVFVAAHNISKGLEQVKQTTRLCATNERREEKYLSAMQSFVDNSEPQVTALASMANSVEHSLRDVLAYFGEAGDEAMKPEEFFALVSSFSSDLQKAALELPEEAPSSEPLHQNTGSGGSDGGSIVPPLPNISSQPQRHLKAPSLRKETLRGLGSNSMIRGQFDQTLRSMKDGHRTTRNRLSKIFLDS